MTARPDDPSDGAADGGLGLASRVVVFVGTILVLVMLAVLPLLTPWFIHAALDASGAADLLGVESGVAHGLSDRSVGELVMGPGTFEMVGPDGTPFYDDDEQDHLRDARTLLWALLIAGGISVLLVGAIGARATPAARSGMWRAISRAGLTTLIVIVVLGVISMLAFGTVFTLFHQVFFPAGNFSFDPATQRLVQLYPFRFWQIAAAALAVLMMVFATVAWLLGRQRAEAEAARPPLASPKRS